MIERNLPNLGTHHTFILLQNQGEDKEGKEVEIETLYCFNNVSLN